MFREKITVAHSEIFVKHECSLPRLQQHTIGPYHEKKNSVHVIALPLFENRFNIIYMYNSTSPNSLFHSDFVIKTKWNISFELSRDTNTIFCINGSVHRDSILIRSNKMQQYAGMYLLQNHSTCFGVYGTHHQEYIKL